MIWRCQSQHCPLMRRDGGTCGSVYLYVCVLSTVLEVVACTPTVVLHGTVQYFASILWYECWFCGSLPQLCNHHLSLFLHIYIYPCLCFPSSWIVLISHKKGKLFRLKPHSRSLIYSFIYFRNSSTCNTQNLDLWKLWCEAWITSCINAQLCNEYHPIPKWLLFLSILMRKKPVQQSWLPFASLVYSPSRFQRTQLCCVMKLTHAVDLWQAWQPGQSRSSHLLTGTKVPFFFSMFTQC